MCQIAVKDKISGKFMVLYGQKNMADRTNITYMVVGIPGGIHSDEDLQRLVMNVIKTAPNYPDTGDLLHDYDSSWSLHFRK